MNLIQHYINGKIYKGSSSRKGKVFNPATGAQESEVILGTKSDLDHAVENAKTAFEKWSQVTPLQRARIIFKYKELIEKNYDELTKLIVSEHGKVYEDAKGSLTRGLEIVEFACGIPQMLKGEFTENVGTNIDSWSMRQPLGVCAGITPFNFPAMVPMWMFPMAIACGNTFILKPSEKDPSCSIRLAQLFSEAGLPNGVLNVVNGDKEVVDSILTNKDIKAVSFVGSTPIARYIYTTGTSTGKRVQALGGAKNHMVIMPDADLDMATNALMGAAFGSAGERCMAISVAVPVTDKVADALVEKLVPKIEALKIGPSVDPSAEMGPLITSEHLNKVTGYIDEGVNEGAKLVVDGRNTKPSMQGYENGYFIGGSLFDNVTKDMSIYKNEIFGPVLSVVRAQDYNSAVDLIHGHEYANGVAVFTRDGDVARGFSNEIEVGMVGVNVPIPVPMAFHSFGGWKSSLFGDHHMHGMEGVRFYTRLKTTTVRWPRGQRSDPQFTMPTLG